MPLLHAHTIRQLLVEAHTNFGGRPFLISDQFLATVSYSHVLRFAIGLGKEFDDIGVAVGASVAILFHNCGVNALLLLAVIASRRVLVPLNPLSTKNEVEYMLDRAACAAVIVDPGHAKSSSFGNRRTIFVPDHREFFERIRAKGEQVHTQEFDPPHSSDFNGEIVFTSGATGRPKGVRLSDQNLLEGAEAIASVYGFSCADRFLTVCPLFHVSGQLVTTLACVLAGGSTAAVQSDIGLPNFWHYVDRYRATWSVLITPFLAILLAQDSGPSDPSAVRGIVIGGSAIDGSMVARFEARFGVPVRTAYALTETTSICTCEYLDPSPRSLGSSGRPLPNCRVIIDSTSPHIVTTDGHPRHGEILISGKNVFDSYIGDPELTERRKQDGWLRTGDVGYLDENGNLFVVDRIDSMIIVAGENVYPAELENLCTYLPGAAQIVLAGVDHPLWGKELVLVYKPQGGEAPSIQVWKRILAEQVSGYKLPHRYVSIQDLGLNEFPQTPVGKLDRRALAALLSAESAPQR